MRHYAKLDEGVFFQSNPGRGDLSDLYGPFACAGADAHCLGNCQWPIVMTTGTEANLSEADSDSDIIWPILSKPTLELHFNVLFNLLSKF